MHVYIGAPLGSFSKYYCKMAFSLHKLIKSPTEGLSAVREDGQVNMASVRWAQFAPCTIVHITHLTPGGLAAVLFP